MFRDVEQADSPVASTIPASRSVIAVVGIDDYGGAWPRLGNAVSDATGIATLFRELGFVQVVPPLLDRIATADALRRLVIDDLAQLGPDDRLVLFLAGHGYTHTTTYGGTPVKTGYLIPADGEAPGGRMASWIRIDAWLSDVSRLPARHILVVLDACHSGIAVESLQRFRGTPPPRGPIEELSARWSRRIITSALGNQRALDGGPYPNHSLFTGYLIEGLRGGIDGGASGLVTGSELGAYIQRRVREYGASQQTPDFGPLELDDRGELLVPLWRPPRCRPEPPRPRHARTTAPVSQTDGRPPHASRHDIVPSSAAFGSPRSHEGFWEDATALEDATVRHVATTGRDLQSGPRIVDTAPQRKRSNLLDVLWKPIPVSRIIVWGCVGLLIPVIGVFVLAYAERRYQRTAPPRPLALRAGRILGVIGTIWTLLYVALRLGTSAH